MSDDLSDMAIQAVNRLNSPEYAELTKEEKLEHLTTAIQEALDDGAHDALDVLFDEFRKLRRES